MENENQKPSTEELQKKLTECEKLRDDYLAGWQRQKADFLNFKREQGEAAMVLTDAIYRQLVFAMAPLISDIDRAFSTIPEDVGSHEWIKGLKQISLQFKKFLSTIGVEEITNQGPYNPEFHEAIGVEEVEGKESGAIAEVVEKGYTLHGKVIKPSKVKVAK
jgi:molecular chaperone GrpE